MTDPVARALLLFEDTALSQFKGVDFVASESAPASPLFFEPQVNATWAGGTYFGQNIFTQPGNSVAGPTDPIVVAMPGGLETSWAAAQAADYDVLLANNTVAGVGAIIGVFPYRTLDNHILVVGTSKAVVLEYDEGTSSFLTTAGSRRVFDYGAAAAAAPIANVFAVSWHMNGGELCPRFWFHNRYAFDTTVVYYRQVTAGELPAGGGSVTISFRVNDGNSARINCTALDSFTDQYTDPVSFESDVQLGAVVGMAGAMALDLGDSAAFANVVAYNSTDDSVRGNGGGYFQGPGTLESGRAVCTFYDRVFQTVCGCTVTPVGDGYNFTATDGRLDAPTQLFNPLALEPVYVPSGGFVYSVAMYPDLTPPAPGEPEIFWTSLRKASEAP